MSNLVYISGPRGAGKTTVLADLAAAGVSLRELREAGGKTSLRQQAAHVGRAAAQVA